MLKVAGYIAGFHVELDSGSLVRYSETPIKHGPCTSSSPFKIKSVIVAEHH